jgi:hypothetical protein
LERLAGRRVAADGDLVGLGVDLDRSTLDERATSIAPPSATARRGDGSLPGEEGADVVAPCGDPVGMTIGSSTPMGLR